jgi:hypothetical protein
MKSSVFYIVVIVMVFLFLGGAGCNESTVGMTVKACHQTCVDETSGTEYAIALRGVAWYHATDKFDTEKGCYIKMQGLRGEWLGDDVGFDEDTVITKSYTDNDQTSGEDDSDNTAYQIHRTKDITFFDSDFSIADFSDRDLFDLLYGSYFDLTQTDTAIQAVFYHKIDSCAFDKKLSLTLECDKQGTYGKCGKAGDETTPVTAGNGGWICKISGGDCRDDVNWNLIPDGDPL